MWGAAFVYIFTLPLLGGAILLWRTGVLSFRWWAILILLAGLVFSFPAVVFYSWLRPVLEPYIESLGPAQWIEDLSRDFLCIVSFTWVVALAAVILLKGVTFSRRKWLAVAVVAAVMLPASVLNCLWVQLSDEHALDPTVAQAVSPDGRCRAYCVRTGWADQMAELAYERNQWFHVARREGAWTDVTFLVRPTSSRYRVVWSRDSQVASVWVGDYAILAEQIVEGKEVVRGLGHSEAGGMSVETRLAEQSECTAKVRVLLDAHEGAAP